MNSLQITYNPRDDRLAFVQRVDGLQHHCNGQLPNSKTVLSVKSELELLSLSTTASPKEH